MIKRVVISVLAAVSVTVFFIKIAGAGILISIILGAFVGGAGVASKILADRDVGA